VYRKELNRDGTTRHSRACQAAYGRTDPNCPRCLELRKGATPRPGWQQPFFARKMRRLQRSLPLSPANN